MLNKRLKSLRLSRSLTQDELARQINISPSAVSMYENGAREPDLSTLIAFAKFFNVSSDYLLGLSDNQQPAATEDIQALIKSIEDMVQKVSFNVSIPSFDYVKSMSKAEYDSLADKTMYVPTGKSEDGTLLVGHISNDSIKTHE